MLPVLTDLQVRCAPGHDHPPFSPRPDLNADPPQACNPEAATLVAYDMVVHLPVALTVMLASWLLGRGLGVASAPAIWLGWFAAACVLVVREVTQHEYRWIAAFGRGRRANMPALEGLKFWEWNAHSLVETGGALLLSALVALAIAKWA